MQIHELNSFQGTPGDSDFIAIDNGTETLKVPATDVYPAMTQAEAEAGTVTALRVIAPNIFKAAIAKLTLSVFYPVGSYYETSDSSFNPNTAWGGTWVKETAGRFHISAGSGYSVGATGGSKDAVVVAHTHSPGNGTNFGFITYEAGTGTGRAMLQTTSSGGRYAYVGGSGATSAAESGINYNSETLSTGESGTDKNLPPYIAVNRWHRTA